MQHLLRSWCAFQVLRNYGPKGRSVGKIVEEMSKKGLREFSSARNAKSSVASTCAHDTAFARVAPGTFALRAVPGVVEVHAPSSILAWRFCCRYSSAAAFQLPAPLLKQSCSRSDGGVLVSRHDSLACLLPVALQQHNRELDLHLLLERQSNPSKILPFD